MQAAPTKTAEGIRTQSFPRCILCSSEGEVLYRDLNDPFFGAPGLWQLKRCPKAGCGLVWLDPRPIEADLHLAYATYFTHGAQDGEASAGSSVRDFLYGIYQAANYPPAAMVGLSRAKAEMGQMFLHDLRPGKVLDVGCGDGKFLNRMRGLGWSVDGVDFDEKAVANAKVKYGLTLRHGDLAGAKFAENSFDAVTMSHVIEHVPDPVALLSEARRVLKPGGRLVVTTPNAAGMGHGMFKGYWFGVDPPRHLQLFSPGTLGEAAKRAGLEVKRAFSTAANADIFIGGSFSIRDSAGHRTDAHPRPNVVRTLKTVWLQYREHARLKREPECGEEAVVVGEKTIDRMKS